MHYRKMPKSEDNLSILGFGCMRLPVIDNDPAKIDEDTAIKMVRYAIDEGVNYIDTAYPYHGKGMESPGNSEPFVAKALKDGYRKKVKLATKLPSWLIKSRQDMDRYLNEQLQRLETDCIDYYLIHALNHLLWPHVKSLGVTEFLDSAIKDGRIRFAGFSFHDNSVALFQEIIDSYDWTFCQIQYNYLDEKYQAGRDGLQYAAQKGLGIVIMEPLKGGSLAVNLPESAVETFKKTDAGKTPVEWALRWLWNHPEISVVLSGMNSMEQVIENVSIANNTKGIDLTDDEVGIVNQVKDMLLKNVTVSCTGCGYCMPCPAGVNIPLHFKYLNDYLRFDSQNTKMSAKFMYNMTMPGNEKASNCVQCGKCETHCPQSISIRKKLQEATETLTF
jgi:uncharacterized protein